MTEPAIKVSQVMELVRRKDLLLADQTRVNSLLTGGKGAFSIDFDGLDSVSVDIPAEDRAFVAAFFFNYYRARVEQLNAAALSIGIDLYA